MLKIKYILYEYTMKKGAFMNANVFDILSQKYEESIRQGIHTGETIEYLSDNSDVPIDDILEFIDYINS